MKKPVAESFVPLAQETRIAVSTSAAAHHLCRREQTLRAWACRENGPIRPLRIHGRLAWPVCEIRRLLGCVPFPKSTKRHGGSPTEPASALLHEGGQE